MARYYADFEDHNIFIEDAEADVTARDGEVILEGVTVAGGKYLRREWLIEIFGESAVWNAEERIAQDYEFDPLDDGDRASDEWRENQ